MMSCNERLSYFDVLYFCKRRYDVSGLEDMSGWLIWVHDTDFEPEVDKQPLLQKNNTPPAKQSVKYMISKVRSKLLINVFVQTAKTSFTLIIFQQLLHFIFSLHCCVVVDIVVPSTTELLKQT